MIGNWYGRPACIGYLTFLAKSRDVEALLEPVRRDREAIAASPENPRLTEVQHLLVTLIEKLDPNHIRYDREDLRSLPRY